MDMFRIIIIIASIVGGSYSNMISSRIIGGDSASSSAATYLVSVQDAGWVHVCAGAIIDTRWVLTSASCALNPKIKNVVPGVTTLVDGRIPSAAYHISRATPHPEFYEGDPFNNIGIIRTLQTFVYTSTVKAMPWAIYSLGANQQLTIFGWDLSSKAASDVTTEAPAKPVTSFRLKSLTLTSLSNTQCEKDAIEGSIIEPIHLCGLRSAGRSTCFGDDGLAVISGGRIQGIVGNTPETVADCGKGYPEIYARVSSFSSWISSERARN